MLSRWAPIQFGFRLRRHPSGGIAVALCGGCAAVTGLFAPCAFMAAGPFLASVLAAAAARITVSLGHRRLRPYAASESSSNIAVVAAAFVLVESFLSSPRACWPVDSDGQRPALCLGIGPVGVAGVVTSSCGACLGFVRFQPRRVEPWRRSGMGLLRISHLQQDVDDWGGRGSVGY